MRDPKSAIGVFDSGVGGLTVLRELVKMCPNENFMYLGDTARLPYGTKSKETVIQYALSAAKILLEHNIKCLIVACNTASSVALPALQKAFPHIPVFGVIEPGAKACCEHRQSGKIVVLATESTTRWHAYQKAIHQLNPSLEVIEWACPLFVPLVEEGWTSGPLVKEIVKEVLAPILNMPMEMLVLGCTHYPILKDVIAEVIPNTTIIDSASTTAQELLQLLKVNKLENNSPQRGTLQFMATDGLERFSRIANRFLNLNLPQEKIALVSHPENHYQSKTG
ncbi:MAG TPA: glutamate racemase [Gammaproteobacteria bacterium]|nr:glutamate racemase [Gammaproteobacteria bacterium]